MKQLLYILFVGTLLELFLGGGGRIFEMFGTTLRIILFFVNILLISSIYYQRRSMPRYVLFFTGIVTAVLAFYLILGWVNQARFSLIFEDIKPLSYFYSIIFFSYYINNSAKVYWIASLIKRTSLFMAIFYLLIQTLFFFGMIDFLPFYEFVNTRISQTDFFFRGTGGLFFYKGFLYMIVGLIFWIHSPKSRFKNISILTLVAAMLLTGSRGFILIFAMLYALFYGIPLLLRLNVKFLIVAALLIFGSLYMFTRIDLGNKEESDNIRVTQIVQVFEQINPLSLVIGHGFGNGVPIREVHMEIGYLEVFHKQGILGICLWSIFLIVLYNTYVRSKSHSNLRKPFFLSCLFVLMVSLTNPFFNNPIGISLFLIAWCSLTVLNKNGQNSAIHSAMDKSVL